MPDFFNWQLVFALLEWMTLFWADSSFERFGGDPKTPSSFFYQHCIYAQAFSQTPLPLLFDQRCVHTLVGSDGKALLSGPQACISECGWHSSVEDCGHMLPGFLSLRVNKK